MGYVYGGTQWSTGTSGGRAMRGDRHPSPIGPLVLILVLGVAVLTVGWWAPSAVRTMTTLRGTVDSADVPSVVSAPDRTASTLVHIATALPDAEGAGTGIVLDPAGTVLTNNHVIDGATAIQAV